MRIPLITMNLRRDTDLLYARQRAREITQLLGLSVRESTRATAAVAEIARNALVYGRNGRIAFQIDEDAGRRQALVITVHDDGPGIENIGAVLARENGGGSGANGGMRGARSLMDTFEVTSAPRTGTRVTMSKFLPLAAPRIGPADVERLTGALSAGNEGSPFGELQLQNEELMNALAEITRRKVEAEVLSAAAEEGRERAESARVVAERSVMVQKRFMALTTHEIRTPLGAMLGYLELLDMGLAGTLNEKQLDYFKRVQTACTHLLGITNDFLDMAKGGEGHLTVERHAGRARHVTEAALILVAPQATARSVVIDAANLDGTAYLGDEDRVRQVLLNVLANAVSFTPKGGTVRVTASAVTAAPNGSELTGGPWCAIRIEDSGPGIPPELLPNVFEPFVQVASSTPGRRGTGLGLTVSRQLALLMGGDLTAEGSGGIGGGAAFTLWLAMPP